MVLKKIKTMDIRRELPPWAKVVKPAHRDDRGMIVEFLCRKYRLDGVKIYEKFENSDVTGKRDLRLLKSDTTGFFAPCDEGHLYRITYEAGKAPVREIVEK